MSTWHYVLIVAVLAIGAYLLLRKKTVTIVGQPSANLSLPSGDVSMPPNNVVARSGRLHF